MPSSKMASTFGNPRTEHLELLRNVHTSHQKKAGKTEDRAKRGNSYNRVHRSGQMICP